MNKLQFGLASIILSSCGVVKYEVTPEEYKGVVDYKERIHNNKYNSAYNSDYKLLMTVHINKYEFDALIEYTNKNLYNIVEFDSTVLVKGKVISKNRYTESGELIRKKFVDMKVDTVIYIPKEEYNKILYYNDKCKCYKMDENKKQSKLNKLLSKIVPDE